MEATICIEGLRMLAHHGVLEQERRVGNTFEVSVTLSYDATIAATTDDIDHAISYADIVDTVRAEMEIPSQLLEHAAARIGRALRRRWPQISGGSVTIAKLCPPIAGLDARSVAVTIPILPN